MQKGNCFVKNSLCDVVESCKSCSGDFDFSYSITELKSRKHSRKEA